MLTFRNYISITIIVLLFFVCIFASIAIPVYSFYNIINTYNLNKSDTEYERATVIRITEGSRYPTIVINFKMSNDNNIYRKNYFGSNKYEEWVNVKFNEKRSYCIIEGYIVQEYITDIIMLLLTGFFVYIGILLFKVIINIKYNI
jgi:hypothetical protein